MYQGQFQTQSLRPLTTAHLAQTMTLLSLTINELGSQIENELSSNPALEISSDRLCPNCKRPLPQQGKCPICSQPKIENPDEPVVFVSPKEDFYSREYRAENEFNDEPSPQQIDDLPTYVLRQIAPDLNGKDKNIAAYLLTHLDEDGLLNTSIIEIAAYLHVLPSDVKRVQRLIQNADPLGVGSENSSQAMLVQLTSLEESKTVPLETKQIILEGLNYLSRHQFSELAKILNVSLKAVHEAAQFITENLNPFPSRSFWGDARHGKNAKPDVYHFPDIVISLHDTNENERLVVEIMLPVSGTLRVNQDFKLAMKQVDQNVKGEMKSDLDRASLFIKCLQQRNNTMQRLMSRVVALQKDFILRGEKELIPVTRAVLAKELGVHESTISRAVANKSVQLPNRRIIPLSSFFDRSLNIRTELKDLIASESAPLSDFELVRLLGKKGFKVARRTVAKYRSMEGILPAHLRQAN